MKAWTLEWDVGMNDAGEWVFFTMDEKTQREQDVVVRLRMNDRGTTIECKYYILTADVVPPIVKLPNGNIANNPPFSDSSVKWLVESLLLRDFLADQFAGRGPTELILENLDTGAVITSETHL